MREAAGKVVSQVNSPPLWLYLYYLWLWLDHNSCQQETTAPGAITGTNTDDKLVWSRHWVHYARKNTQIEHIRKATQQRNIILKYFGKVLRRGEASY